jgi:hypothetical protein
VNNSIRTAYLRDASGNIMAVYEYRQGSWSHAEQHLYGADRLGVHNKPVALAASGHNYMFLATKKYELTNHLGNVMAVVTDRRFVHSSNGFATAEVVSATDYFVFGSAMPSREYNGRAYDFGFNTQMESPEILPGHTTAMYWEYDGRIGRRWELDPRPVTGVSGYACLSNNPVMFSDMMGDTTTPLFHDGTVGRTINDPGENRQIYFNKGQDKALINTLYASGKTDLEIANEMRSMDRSYIGPKTRIGLNEFQKKINKEGLEQAFVLYTKTSNGEMLVGSLSDYVSNRTPNGASVNGCIARCRAKPPFR